VVGWQARPRFTPDAFHALYLGSDGVPRRLNQLAGRVLLFGAIEQLDTIDGRAVAAVIDDIAGDSPMPRPVAVAEPVPAPAPAAAPKPVFNDAAPYERRRIRAAPSAPMDDNALAARLYALEGRVEDQDAALRRVLTLLVDWVESEQRPELASLRALSR
jgi:hypothetical protein